VVIFFFGPAGERGRQEGREGSRRFFSAIFGEGGDLVGIPTKFGHDGYKDFSIAYYLNQIIHYFN